MACHRVDREERGLKSWHGMAPTGWEGPVIAGSDLPGTRHMTLSMCVWAYGAQCVCLGICVAVSSSSSGLWVSSWLPPQADLMACMHDGDMAPGACLLPKQHHSWLTWPPLTVGTRSRGEASMQARRILLTLMSAAHSPYSLAVGRRAATCSWPALVIWQRAQNQHPHSGSAPTPGPC